MAEPTKTTIRTITPEELEAEILTYLCSMYEHDLTPGEIRRGLSATGVNCDVCELVTCLASMDTRDLIDMSEEWKVLDEDEGTVHIVRFHLTSKGAKQAGENIRTHYVVGDGCDPPHTLDDLSMCHGLPGRD